MSISSLFLEDFGQKVDLTRRIREVLLNYPEGTTILKELVQNADDAGARAFKLCLDRRSHGERSLLSETLAEWQGPALLAYNDAVFGEDDFVSISRIGGSGKRKQGWKTGRFGVGFNSVYHLTDLPSFVSGKHVVLFDPQSSYLPNISSANPGKRIDFVSSNALSLNEDQFLPYCAFGCDMKKHFNGTLFRFPLRNADQAGKSRLSTQAYADDDIHSMFTQFYDEGVFALLFLKSVVSIEMYIWDVGELEPRKLYSCSVKSVDDDAVSHRQLLLRLSKSCSSGGEIDAFQLDFLSQAMSGSCCQERVDSFYIVQNMASATSRIAALATCASKDFDMHLLPWASVAACISTDLGNDKTLKVGRAFCFLPLPVRTGLAVQVNGYFEVSSNRRGIWYGEDMDRSGKVRSLWNRLLLEDVVAPAFLQLLLSVQGILGHSELYYSLWPSGEFDEPWNILVECIYKIAAQAPVLCAEIEGGKWIAPAEAFLHDKEFRRSDELGHVLVQLGMPIVHLPNFLCDMLLKQSKEFHQKVVTHDTVRHFLREFGSGKIGRPQKLLLLEYCLEDLIDSDVGRHAYNLPLVPLGNGQDGSLSEASKGTSYFICNELEYVLLEQISDRVVNRGIPGEIFSRLSAIAESSGANLIVFTLGHFVQLFDQFVPSAWRYKSKVLWKLDVGRYSGPSPAWFRLLWEYLGCECKSLSLFDAWPILPSTSGHLYRASRLSKLIDIGGLSERMRLILDKVGCKILDCNYGVKHPELSQYVSDTNGAAVLESIFHAVSSSYSSLQIHISDLESEEKNELRIFLLDPKWYFNSVMAEPEIHKCKQLPIFMVYFLESPQSFHFCNLVESQKYLPPLDVPSSFLGNEFISTSSSLEDEILQKFYGLPRMGKAHFYRRMVFNRFSSLQPEDRDQIMLALIRDLPQLCIEDSSFKEILRNTEFIPTRTGAVKCPTDLYDPRNEELHALLEEADLFPCGVFEESNVLDALQSLGLRTSVSLDTIIQCARHIEAMRQVDLQSACLRGKVLLSYLEANAHRWVAASSSDDKRTLNRMISRAATALRPRTVGSDLDKFWSDLRVICWCPVVVSAPYPTLPWPAVSSAVAPPKLVRLKTDMWLASGSMRILDGECSSTALSYHLGWSSPIGGSVIAAQLLELGKNNDFVTDQVFRQELAQVMPRIYARLAELTGSDEMDVVKAILEGSRWIWVGDGFATSDEVVLSGPLHLAPYIRVIPVDLAVFKKLFLELSVPEILNFADYANILCRMAAHKGEDSLTAQELTAAILVVQHLAEAQYQDKHVNIFLPDTSGRLFSTFDLVYNDAPWLLGMENSSRSLASLDNAPVVSLKSKRAGRKFVHGHISNDVAEKLGVCSLRRLLLSESADSMNLGLSGAAEAFGQHEALTTRLKHILEMYANGPGTLFELVQNAEDAGASKVVFLLDKTHFGTSSVLSPDMADWQGPALYCYNDSVFSQQDLYAISRIGQESKLEKPFAIGRFGLGFNSVYHFTDVPSFVSGENVVMFDPHACNLPGISPTHPGLRIRFVGRTILEQFPDQFSPFLYFGCDLQHLFPGTLFRFPLRSPSVAHRSQIKKEAYSPEDVISLFSSFSKVVSETLLFLRKVKSISIFVKDGSSEMQLIHHCDRYTLMDPESQSHAANDMFEYIHGVKQLNMDKDQLLKKLRKSIDKDLPWICQKVFVREESTSGKFLHRWIVSECLGGGSDDSDSATLATRSLNCVPWAAVAARVLSAEVNDESSEASIAEDLFASNSGMSEMVGFSLQQKNDFEGRAFCFLPLPMNTGLPVHVNAYFELTSNRRDIWLGNDMSGGGKKRSDWNKYLLEHVAAPAYARLLEKMAVEVGPSDMFFSFWPTGMMVEPWSSMQQKLYLYITDYGVRVLYTKAKGGWWITTKQALFPDFTFSKMHLLVDILSEAGFTVVTLSQPLVERFMEAQPSLHYLTPHLLRTLLIRRKYGFSERRAMLLMLEYCLLDLRKPVRPDCLYGLSLLPLADGSSATFNRLGIDERIYIAKGEDYGLLKDSIPSQLVDMDIPDEIYGKLCDVAQSEVSNISFLSPQLLEKLFLRILPVDWQNVKQVDWVPGHDGQPSLEWMKLLWSYLRSSCNDLSVFSKWPILPVGSNYLQQLVKNSNIIEDYGWSENLSSLLLKVGCQFLRQDIAIEHPQLHNYVQSATAAGISNAFLSLAGSVESVEVLFSDAIEGELHELRSFFLQSKWYSETHMLDMQIEVLKHIPMFESYKSRKLVSLSNGIKWLKPSNVREDFLDDSFIRAESEKERIILNKYLNVREASKAEFYKDYVLNQMPRFLPSQEAVFAILQDVKMLLKEDSSLKAALSSTPFVLASNGIWQHPCRLYDPRIPELRAMLHRDVFFPSGNFSDPETLDMLVGLGLKQRLGYTGLLDCARSVSICHDQRDAETVVQGRRLLACLDAVASKLHSRDGLDDLGTLKNHMVGKIYHAAELGDSSISEFDWDVDLFLDSLIDDGGEEDLWSELKAISWCPICADPPLLVLPWLRSSDLVAVPSIVRPKSQMWTVSSSMHILDAECRSTYVQSKLGWMDLPKADVLCHQLIALAKSYAQVSLGSAVNLDFEVELQKGITSLYSTMQEILNIDNCKAFQSALQGVPCIWIGDGFVPAHILAFDSPVKFHPYLYVVPSELSEFRDLLLALGVKLSLEASDYL
ncbi:Sacsin-like protein, partial [Drosera capensis]